MKTLVAIFVITIASGFVPPKDNITGSWKCVRSKYGNAEMKDRSDEDVFKIFTATRWSTAFFNKAEKKLGGAGGGTYTLKNEKYAETVEYYSWDAEAVGKTFTFTLKIENGMLHQTGTMEYKGDLNYPIEEWFKRV